MWTRLRLWITSFTRRDRFEDELTAELEFHVAARAEQWEREGLTPDEARRRARIEFGSIEKTKAQVRDVRRGAWLKHVGPDLRYGQRMLRKHPGFTAVAVLSLALGIGANTAIFSFVNALVLREVPIDRPEELVDIYKHLPSFEFSAITYRDYEDLRDGTTNVFSRIAATTFTFVQIDRGEGVEAGMAEAVTGDFFPLLGIEAMLGQAIGPADNRAPGAHPVVMLSHGYWQSRFGGDANVVGQELRIGGRAYTIVGVAPADYPGSFRGVEPVVFAPAMMLDELMGLDMLESRGVHLTFGKARLAPGVTLAQAETAVAAVGASLTATRPEGWEPGSAFALLPTTEVLLYPLADPFIRAGAWLLMVVVGLVLLLACTNLASFLLARGRDRRREVAVRLALGASRGTLVRQLLTETTLLSLVAGGTGIGLAVWLLHILGNADLPVPFAVTLDLSLDWNVLAFTLGISVLAGIVVGLIPALQTTRPDIAWTLQSETAGGGRPGQLRWQNALIVTQLTVSLVLLVGAGLFLRSWQHVQAVDPGFGREPAAIVSVLVPSTRFSADERRQYARRLLDRFRELPGVDTVGVIDNLPLSFISAQWIDFNVDGHEPPQDREAFQADHAVVDAEFFDAVGISIVRGRRFGDADEPDSQRVAIVSEAMARRFWPNGDAVGRLLRRPAAHDADLLVVGVARDIKVRSLGETPRFMVYLPYSQAAAVRLSFVARASASPEETALALLSAGREVDSELRVYETKTMAQHLSIMLLPAQVSAFLLFVFAILALALAAIGLYGVVSYVVSTRTHEVGIRMALGANTAAVVRLLATSGTRLVLLGSGIGLAVSLLVTRSISGLLFDIDAFDPITFVAAPLVLGVTALLAAYLPAYRASRVDPVIALRAD